MHACVCVCVTAANFVRVWQVYLRNGDMEFAEEVCGKALQIAELPKNAVPSGLRAKAGPSILLREVFGRNRGCVWSTEYSS